jgi:DNA-binding NarL/FixJ family response regulator
LEDKSDAARKLRLQLLEWRSDVRICESADEVRAIAAATDISESIDPVFVLDINLGENREREGLDVIQELDTLRKAGNFSWYIAALSTHSECEPEATRLGADVFLVKESHPTDALELQTRVDAREAERMSVQAQLKQSKLAEREYKELKRRLQNVKKGQAKFIGSAVATVNRGLGWPLLPPSDQLVLSLLIGPLSHAEQEETIEPDLLDACLEGVDLLLRRADEREFADWAGRMRNLSSHALVPWLHSGDLDDIDDWSL